MGQLLSYENDSNVSEAIANIPVNTVRMTVSVLGSNAVKCEVKPYGMDGFEEVEDGVIDGTNQKSITIDGIFEKIKLSSNNEFNYAVAFQS